MDFGFTDEQNLLRDSVAKLMQRHAPPDVIRRHDRERTFPYELYDACVEAGLLRPAIPGRLWRPRWQRHRSCHRRAGNLARQPGLRHGVFGQHLLRP